SFKVLGDCISTMAFIFFGFALIPSEVIERFGYIHYHVLLAFALDDHVVHICFEVSSQLRLEGRLNQPLDRIGYPCWILHHPDYSSLHSLFDFFCYHPAFFSAQDPLFLRYRRNGVVNIQGVPD
nr:hypothetical protein [Tanacetum cinerariifolium]